MLPKPGAWMFMDRVAGTQTTIQVKDGNASTIKAAFLAAVTALAATSNDNVIGMDPVGHRHRYSSVSLYQP